MADNNEESKPTTKDLASAITVCQEPIPTIFIDGFQGISFSNENVRINLYEDRFNPVAQELSRYIVSRLVMSLSSFDSFVTALKDIRDKALIIDGANGEVKNEQ